jgi:flagellar assembly factor FliW
MNTLELMEPEKKTVTGENLLRLPLGLLGFELVKNYALLSRPHEEPFYWLQMLEDAKHAFLIVSPFIAVPDYEPDISQQDVDFLGLTTPADSLVYNIVTLRGKGPATINLKGPIIINRHTMVGKQVIPNNAATFSLHHPLPVS